MIRQLALVIAAGSILLAGLACQPAAGGAGPQMDSTRLTFVHDGLERTYELLKPDRLSGRPALVLGLHGGGGDGQQFCSMGAGISELVNEAGFLMVCPDAIDGHWNDGREIDTYRAHRENIDDVGFLTSLIRHLTMQYQIDPGRIYVTGSSNGGMMAYRLACEATAAIAAGAALIANLPADLECRPSGPIPMLIMNGTQDPLMPFEGGSVTFLRRQMGTVLSTPDTFHFWASSNGCSDLPRAEALPDRSKRDGSQIVRRVYPGCDRGSRVVLIEVQGGGHTVPGGQQYAPRWLIGAVNRDAHAGRLIWDFFSLSD